MAQLSLGACVEIEAILETTRPTEASLVGGDRFVDGSHAQAGQDHGELQ
jgi:hypothetical protein